MFEIFKQLPPGKWVSAGNLLGFIQYRFIPVRPVTNWALNNRLYFEKPPKDMASGYAERKYAETNVNMLLQYPFIKGTIFLFGSFGLIEIAYEDIDTKEFGKTFYSGYDGLAYLRLTALGAYVSGLSALYQPVEAQLQNKLQFSEDSLMILAEGDMGVLDVMLASFAEKAASNRYNVTHTNFLKDCKITKDIENKIALFKKTISGKLPAYWE